MAYENILPAGTYWVGDPCYVFTDEEWDTVLDVTDCFEREEATINGHRFAATATVYGDGCYESNVGFMFGVDAGLIGAVPVELVTMEVDENSSLKVTFDRPFRVYRDSRGTIHIGHIEIETGYEDEDEDEDY